MTCQECSRRYPETIAGKSVDEVLKNPIQGAIELADELGKEPPIFEVTDPALRIPSKTSELLQNVLVHVFRNSVDHGLESGTERSEAGKDQTGRITVQAESDDRTLTISVWDDGRGLDLQRYAISTQSFTGMRLLKVRLQMLLQNSSLTPVCPRLKNSPIFQVEELGWMRFAPLFLRKVGQSRWH